MRCYRIRRGEKRHSKVPGKPTYKAGKDRAGHYRSYAINATRIISELGSTPVNILETDVEQTINW